MSEADDRGPARVETEGEAASPTAPVVILCRPQIGENVGATARAMMNFGLGQLRLVAPECGWPNAKAVAMASGAWSVLNDIQIFETLEQGIADLHHVYATTARLRELKKPVLPVDEALPEAKSLVAEGRRVGLVFGAERTGLENHELLLADAIIRIPTNPAFSSLNLGQAVLIVSYEWGRAALSSFAARRPDEVLPATKGEVDGLLRQFLAELDEAEFFKSPDSRLSLSAAIKVMIEKRGWSRAEINLMRGCLKELVIGTRRRTLAGR